MNCVTSVHESCDTWEVCNSGSHSCQCAGKCLDKPTNPLLWDGNAVQDPLNVFLPTKLDWAPVPHALSYQYRINNTTEGTTQHRSVPTEATTTSCIMKSGVVHTWKVVPCCDASGWNCKPWPDVDTWSFTTNLAPEPVSPYDPDWNNIAQKAENVIPFSATLDWCDVENAQFYELKIYIIENGTENCHPWLQNGECNYYLISPGRKPPPNPDPEPLRSEFVDTLGFFTKDSEYRWKVSTCVTGDTSNCSDYGQKWGFGTDPNASLPHVTLISPSNGSTEGFPLTLKWKKEPGMNSFRYRYRRIGSFWPVPGTTSLDSVTFDPSQLTLDWLYQWQVKPCWDYAADPSNCEN